MYMLNGIKKNLNEISKFQLEFYTNSITINNFKCNFLEFNIKY